MRESMKIRKSAQETIQVTGNIIFSSPGKVLKLIIIKWWTNNFITTCTCNHQLMLTKRRSQEARGTRCI